MKAKKISNNLKSLSRKHMEKLRLFFFLFGCCGIFGLFQFTFVLEFDYLTFEVF